MVLRGSIKSLKPSKQCIRIELMAEFLVNPKVSGMELWRRNLEVNYNVKVAGLGKKGHISSQDYNNKLHSRGKEDPIERRIARFLLL